MNDRAYPSFLRLVEPKIAASRADKSASKPQNIGWQPTLFPEFNPNLAVAIDLDHLSKDYFVELIERVRPRFVVDLRVIPRFDYVGFNRKVAFEFFNRVGSAYFDFTGDVGVRDERDARLNPVFVTEYVQNKVCRSKSATGPLVFLIGGREAELDYIPMLAHHLSGSEGRWQWMQA